jgi:transcriptional regulator with XRE-family HTH domain
MFNPRLLSLARRRRGLTQIRFAQELGVKRLTVYRYETGDFEPPPDALAKIAKVLKFPIEFF